MSTQFDTQHTHTDDTYAYGQPAARRRAPRRGGNGLGYRITAIVIGTVIAAALIVLAVIGVTHTTSTSTRRPPPPPRPRPSPPTRRSRQPRPLLLQRR